MTEAAERAFTKKGASTRDRIVEVARQMLLERGYEGLVMRELADSLGMKLGNLQYYFATREALALHVLGLELNRDLAAVHEQRGVTSPVEAFRTVTRDMMVRHRGDSGRLILMVTSLAQHNELFRRRYIDSNSNIYSAFEALLAEMRPGLTARELATRARVINALVEGSSFQTHVGSVEAYVDRVLAEAEAIALA